MGASAAFYEIRWRLQGSSAAWKSRTFPASGDHVELSGLERGQTYDIEARALSDAGTPSDWVPVTVLIDDATRAPRAPTNLAAQSVADGVALSWQVDAEQAADVEYIVERAAAETGPFTTLTRVRALQYTDPVTDQVIRWYRVRAVNFQGVLSAPSQAVNSNGKASSVLISETAPANPAVGTQWHQPSTNLTRVWNGSGWSLMADNSLVTQQTATLVKDGGFEAGGQGWVLAPNARIDRGTGVPYIGSAALTHDPVAGGPIRQSGCDTFAVAPGERIVAEAMLRNWQGGANGYAALMIWFYDQSGGFIATGAYQFYADGRDAGSKWRKCTALALVPANARLCRIGMETTNSAGFWVGDQFRALKQPQVEPQPSNLIPNANFGGINGDKAPWVLTWNPNNAVIDRFRTKKEGMVGPDWTVEGATGQLEIHQAGRTGGSPGVVDFHCGTTPGAWVSVIGSQRYEYSIYAAAHRCQVAVGVVWFDALGAQISYENTTPSSVSSGGRTEAGFTRIGGFAVAPSNAAFGRLFIRKMDTDAGQADSWCWFLKAYLGPAKADQKEFSPWVPGPTYTADEVPSGSFGVVSTTDLYDANSTRRIGLRVHGSGHRLGSQSNAPQSLTTAYGSVRNTTALTASSSGAVSVNAHVVRYGGFSVAYNAVTNAVTGLAQNTRYVIYCFDPDYTGGTKTWYAGTNPDAVMKLGDGVVIAGEVTIPNSGTGSGGGGSGGGDDWCVDATMRLPDGRIAGDVAAGDIIACWDENAAAPGVQERAVESSTLVESQPCTRIMTVSGAAVVASDCTPMTLRDGRIVRITQMVGEDALVRHADGTLAWEPVVSCTPVGSRTVAKIKVHQLCYFAGESAAATIATHNPIAKP